MYTRMRYMRYTAISPGITENKQENHMTGTLYLCATPIGNLELSLIHIYDEIFYDDWMPELGRFLG